MHVSVHLEIFSRFPSVRHYISTFPANIISPNINGAANIQPNKSSYATAVGAAKFGSKCSAVRDSDCWSKRIRSRSERNAIFTSKFDCK
jgi:hypothetical protein